MASVFKLACVVLPLATMSCSGFKEYRSTAENNLLIRTKLSGSAFTGVKARLHIYAWRGPCDGTYIGTVKLDRDEIRIGLPPQRTHLKFMFVTSARLGGSTAAVPYTVELTPRDGSEYVADVTYRNHMYDVSIREGARQGRPSRVIDRYTADCP